MVAEAVAVALVVAQEATRVPGTAAEAVMAVVARQQDIGFVVDHRGSWGRCFGGSSGCCSRAGGSTSKAQEATVVPGAAEEVVVAAQKAAVSLVAAEVVALVAVEAAAGTVAPYGVGTRGCSGSRDS